MPDFEFKEVRISIIISPLEVVTLYRGLTESIKLERQKGRPAADRCSAGCWREF